MATDKRSRFTVITNPEVSVKPDIEQSDTKAYKTDPPLDSGTVGYQTNPLYQKLLQFKTDQKRKRFSVEDLLRW